MVRVHPPPGDRGAGHAQAALRIVPLLAMMAACTSSSPKPREPGPAVQPTPQSVETTPASEVEQQRLVSAMATQCRDRVGGHQGAVVTSETSAVLVRDDRVQVDGTMEWRGEGGCATSGRATCSAKKRAPGTTAA